MTSPPARWPLHPVPGPIESVSSWLGRMAAAYGMTAQHLIANLDLGGTTVPVDLDLDPPPVLLDALSIRTGVDVDRLRAMTLAGWQGYLFDQLRMDKGGEQATFDCYVRQNSVLLAPGEAGTNQLYRHSRRWAGPWQPYRPHPRICPVCVTDPDRGRALFDQLPLMISCVIHGCRLDDTAAVHRAIAFGEPHPAVPVDEPTATMDRYTYQALTVGRVTLPGRSVHAFVWFRLLRSLLDEVSLATTTRSRHGRLVLERVWATLGEPERAGLNIWQPYEVLDWSVQEKLLRAAATALWLAAECDITVLGIHGDAIQPPRPQRVYAGDEPPRSTVLWREIQAAVDDMIEAARHDPDIARQVWNLFTWNGRAPAALSREREFLLGLGIPVDFLPSAEGEWTYPISSPS